MIEQLRGLRRNRRRAHALNPQSLYTHFKAHALNPQSLYTHFKAHALNPQSLYTHFKAHALKPQSLYTHSSSYGGYGEIGNGSKQDKAVPTRLLVIYILASW